MKKKHSVRTSGKKTCKNNRVAGKVAIFLFLCDFEGSIDIAIACLLYIKFCPSATSSASESKVPYLCFKVSV